MGRFLFTLAVLAVSVAITACNKNESSQSAVTANVERKNAMPAGTEDGNRALAFLSGIQNSDKKLMYEVSNLTPEIVAGSRQKLTDTITYKQSKIERANTEHALRMSGNIDFFHKKLTKIFPKSAQLQLMQTTQNNNTKDPVKVHLIKITYSKKDDALLDKKGQCIKEMVVRLQQVSYKVDGRTLQEFVFDNKDFDKMADKEYDVLSYF